jgi:hypothetical protein
VLRSFIAAATFVAAFVVLAAPPAQADDLAWPADYDPGCEFIRWGFVGSQERTICDGPKRPDGSWTRGRMIATPAHILPAKSTCSSGKYSSSCTFREKTYVDEAVHSKDHYVVFDNTVLPDEPPWLPPGTMRDLA